MRRTIGELEDSRDYYRDLLLSLLASLRSPEQDQVNRILDLIQSNASLPDIAASIVIKTPSGGSRAADMISSGGLEDTSLQSMPSPFVDSHTQVTMEMLCDIPLFKVPAKPWTTITDDDHLISHLISLYFTWHHPFSQLVDQDIFLDEMTKGDLSSELCTPFLVNSMLAVASVCCRQLCFCQFHAFHPDLVGLLRLSQGTRHSR